MTLDFNQQQKPNYSTRSFDFLELTNRATIRHTAPVGANHQQTAKFRDSFTHTRRQTRLDDAAGFFMPVDFAHSGFLPGMRGLKNLLGGNKRVVLLVDEKSTRQLCQIFESKLGAVTMTAIAMGNTAQNPLARLPHIPLLFPKAGKKRKSTADLVYESTPTGLIVHHENTPVAWIYPGYHQGQIDGKPTTSKFVDVAYHRRTEHGVNLETRDFDTLQQAIDFITATFGQGGAK